MSTWSDLIEYYKSFIGVTPQLKIASLAQWIVESGRGGSELAKQHLNFGGLKFRQRMQGYADPIDYRGSDGELTTYCKFTSIDGFVRGYWHFISSGPYEDYLSYNSDAAGYLRYIARQGYAADRNYIATVLSVFDEAERLLGAETQPAHGGAASALARVALVVGHNRRASGAFAGSPINQNEFAFNTVVANAAKAEAWHYNLTAEVFFREPHDSYTAEIREVYGKVREWGADCSVELHFNSGPSSASGSSVLVRRDRANARALAESTLGSIVNSLALPNRGVVLVDPADRGGGALYALDSVPAILVEPFFGSNRHDTVQVTSIGPTALALAYLRGVRSWVQVAIA